MIQPFTVDLPRGWSSTSIDDEDLWELQNKTLLTLTKNERQLVETSRELCFFACTSKKFTQFLHYHRRRSGQWQDGCPKTPSISNLSNWQTYIEKDGKYIELNTIDLFVTGLFPVKNSNFIRDHSVA